MPTAAALSSRGTYGSCTVVAAGCCAGTMLSSRMAFRRMVNLYSSTHARLSALCARRDYLSQRQESIARAKLLSSECQTFNANHLCIFIYFLFFFSSFHPLDPTMCCEAIIYISTSLFTLYSLDSTVLALGKGCSFPMVSYQGAALRRGIILWCERNVRFF